MRWGPSAQTDRDTDLVLDEIGEYGSPLGLMLSAEISQQTGKPTRKIIPFRMAPSDEADKVDDQTVAWTDWSLGMAFGRVDRLGRGGYSYGLGLDARNPRRLMPAGKVTDLLMPLLPWDHAPIRGFQEFGSHVYCVTGPDSTTPSSTSTILRIVNGDDYVILSGKYQADTAPYFSGRSIIQYRGNLYVGGYNGFMKRKMNITNDPDSGPLDDNTAGDGSGWDEYSFQRVFLAKQNWRVAGIEDYYLIANDTDYSMVYTAADPTSSGNWSSPTAVIQDDPTKITYLGDQRYKIKSVATSNRRIWWGKTDGMWDINSSGTATNATPFVEDALDDSNCQSSFYHDGFVYFWTSMGLMRMGTNDRIRLDVPENVQPGFGRPISGPIFGEVSCNPTSDNGWLVVPIYNGRDSFLLYAQEPSSLGIDAPVPLIWHGAFAWFPERKITALGKTSLSGWPKLLIGLWDPVAEEASISTQYMLKNGSAYQAWQHDTDYKFRVAWTVYFTGDDLGLPNTRKALLRGDATSENTTTARKIEIFTAMDDAVYPDYDTDGNPFWTLTPPIGGSYTLEVGDYGTTAAIDNTATAVEIEDAIAAISGLTADNVVVELYGIHSRKVTLIGLPSTTTLRATGQAYLTHHLHGTALTTARQAFLPTKGTPTGYVINSRIDGIGTEQDPPMLTSLRWRVSTIEDRLEEREFKIRIGHGVQNRHGTPDDGDPFVAIQKLNALATKGPIQFIDEHGRTLYGKVKSGLSGVKIEEDGGYVYEITFRVKIQRQPFYWGSGVAWGDIYSFS